MTVDPPVAQTGDPWHALEPEEVERRLDTGAHGLTAAAVQARLTHHGPNQLEEEPPPSPMLVFVRQFPVRSSSSSSPRSP